MSSNYTDKKFKKLLDKLQQDSWQLELLISGFAIFGLFTAIETLKVPLNEAKILGQIYKGVFLGVVLTSCFILIFNLLVHIILRGLWIGALGLRYISGDIDFEELNYHNRFKNYLKNKIVSFDKYIATLENYCSVLFAISFLLIFYLISFFIILFIIAFTVKLVFSNKDLPELFRQITGGILLAFMVLGTLLTLIDFFTQGYLKKKKIISKIYFPFYWVFSYFTLSFLYRPLVYNFLDNKFGKRLSLFLVPVYITLFVATSLEYKSSNYLNKRLSNDSMLVNYENYEDMLTAENDLVNSITIQSEVIKESYIRVFCVFTKKTEDRIFDYSPALKPENDARGYYTGIKFSVEDSKSIKKRDSLSKKYVEAFNKIHQIYIDTLKYKHRFLIKKNNKNQLGFVTYVNIKELPEGQHVFKLKTVEKDTTKSTTYSIPFWNFKK